MKKKPYPMFEEMCTSHSLPQPKRELRFHATRKWQLDFAWLFYKVALEVEGGAFSGHGHRSVGKFLRDLEKYNEAALAGWTVIRCTTDDLKTGSVFELIKRAIRNASVQANIINMDGPR